MQDIINYIKSNKNNYIEELKDFLRIPSISALAENKEDMKKAAQFAADKLKQAGIGNVKIFPTEGHPIVFGEWLGAPGKPTILVYGHYDVQPVDPIELWDNPPFEPVVKGNKIYGRGTTDDKGQLYVHIKSVEAFFKVHGSLPLNVKFILEGEEEIGSENLEIFINQNKNLLKCDTVLVSDTSLYEPGLPTLTYALRGLAFFEIEVTGPNKDLHSGSFGGAVANPVNILAEIIAKLHDKKNKVAIPGFYDDVTKLSKKERDNFKLLKFDEKSFKKEIGIPDFHGEEGFTTLERIWARPTLDCNGIFGGFTGTGAKTIIPAKATAKISMRLVASQNAGKIGKLFAKFVKEIAPKSVKVKVTEMQGGAPFMTPITDKAIVAASNAMAKAFGKKTVYIRDGGSIPVITTFAQKLNAPIVLMGIGLETENLHSPNEHFNLDHFELGILSSALFIDEYSKI